MSVRKADYATASPVKTYSKKVSARGSLYPVANEQSDADGSPRKSKRRRVDYGSDEDDQDANLHENKTVRGPIETVGLNADKFLLSTPESSREPRKFREVAQESDQETEIASDSDENVKAIESPKKLTPSRNGLSTSTSQNGVSYHGSPSTPSRPPRNLSEIFDFVSPKSSHKNSSLLKKRHRSLTERMLSRSASGSSATPTPTSFNEGTSSKEDFMNSSSIRLSTKSSRVDSQRENTTFGASEEVETRSVVSTPSLSRTSQSRTRTYAGDSRSFLVAVPIEALTGKQDTKSTSLGFDLTDAERDALRESYSELRQRWGVDSQEEYALAQNDKDIRNDPVVSNPDLYNPLSSITELRSKGESRRILDEIEYLFEGLESDDDNKGLKQSSAVELLNKMCSGDFLRRAKIVNFSERAWDALRKSGAGDGDVVLDLCLCVFTAIIAHDRRELSDLARKFDVATTIAPLLQNIHSRDFDILNEDDFNFGRVDKAEKALLRRICNIAETSSDLIEGSKHLYIRDLLSRTLRKLSPLLHDNIAVVMDSVVRDLSLLNSRLKFLMQQPIEQCDAAAELFSLQHISNCLDVLDSYLLEGSATHGFVQFNERSTPLISGLFSLIALYLRYCGKTGVLEDSRLIYRSLESALRILVNLTNDDAEWCNSVLGDSRSLTIIVKLIVVANLERLRQQTKSESQDPDIATQNLDTLCLSLALLTNLVHEEARTKILLRSTKFDLHCLNEAKCFPECICPNRINSIHSLVNVYDSQTKTENEMELFASQFIRGHLAMLFGFLMNDSEDNQCLLLSLLPGTNKITRLGSLIQNAEEFVALYADATGRLWAQDGSMRSNKIRSKATESSATNSARTFTSTATEIIDGLKDLRKRLN